jgi:hypothetical protein
MRTLRGEYIPLVAILIAFASACIAYDHLPPRVPVHWGISGRVDKELPKHLGAYLYPAAMAFVYVFFRLIPFADRSRIRQLRQSGVYDPFRNGAVLLFGYGQVLVLGIGLGWISPQANFLNGAGSLLVLLAGAHIRRIRPRPFDRLISRLGIAPSPASVRWMCHLLMAAGACGLIGTFTGTVQILWLAVPLLAGTILARHRFPVHREPTP